MSNKSWTRQVMTASAAVHKNVDGSTQPKEMKQKLHSRVSAAATAVIRKDMAGLTSSVRSAVDMVLKEMDVQATADRAEQAMDKPLLTSEPAIPMDDIAAPFGRDAWGTARPNWNSN